MRNLLGFKGVAKTAKGRTTRYGYEYGDAVLELDGHGDVTMLVDDLGVVVAEYSYDAFGSPTGETGGSGNPYRYSGYVFDAETMLYYLKSRYYDAGIGRFLSEDTCRGRADDPPSLNLYAYGRGNPVRYLDPAGHAVTEWDLANLTDGAIQTLGWLTDLYYDATDGETRAALAAYGPEVGHPEARRIRGQLPGDKDGHGAAVRVQAQSGERDAQQPAGYTAADERHRVQRTGNVSSRDVNSGKLIVDGANTGYNAPEGWAARKVAYCMVNSVLL